ncbi:DMT family transporter, partial [Aeromonas caviae]
GRAPVVALPKAPDAGGGPPWAWLGGLPGALTVVLAALCLNSPLGMAGTLALLLLGQLLFGALCDGLGWLGLARRRPRERRARRLAGDGRRLLIVLH